MSVNALRAFRPRSAPLLDLSRFSFLEDVDEDADNEISDHDPNPSKDHRRHQSDPCSNHHPQSSIGTARENSPPPPAVFIPRDRRRTSGAKYIYYLHNYFHLKITR